MRPGRTGRERAVEVEIESLLEDELLACHADDVDLVIALLMHFAEVGAEYARFITLWKDADEGLPELAEARAQTLFDARSPRRFRAPMNRTCVDYRSDGRRTRRVFAIAVRIIGRLIAKDYQTYRKDVLGYEPVGTPHSCLVDTIAFGRTLPCNM